MDTLSLAVSCRAINSFMYNRLKLKGKINVTIFVEMVRTLMGAGSESSEIWSLK